MSQEQFIFWLKGFMELSPSPPTVQQWLSIKQHMDLLFEKVTPPGPGDEIQNKGLPKQISDWMKDHPTPVNPLPQFTWPIYTTPQLPGHNKPMIITC